MRDKTFRTIGATAVLLGITIAAVARVGTDDDPPAEIAVPTDTADFAERAGPTTIADPTLHYRIGLLAGVTTANFWEYIGDQPTAWNAYVLGPTKPALYGIDSATGELTPDLAARSSLPQPTWDGHGWRVHVEVGRHLDWSDGEPVRATDVVYTFETVRRLGLQGGWAEAFPPEIDEIVAESGTELRVEFSERPGLGAWPHGIGLAPIMPAHVWGPLTAGIDNATDLYRLDAGDDVSGGPFQIVTLTDARIEAVANPGYPGSEIDRITYTVFSDETGAVSAIEEGEIDTVLDPNGLSEESVSLLDVGDEVTVERSPANSVRYLGFNLTRAPMSEPAFRRSLALLLDREAVAEAVLPGGAAAYTMLSPANSRWWDDDQAAAIAAPYLGDIAGRLASALSQLEAAGYVWEVPPGVVDGALTQGTELNIGGQTPPPLTILTPGDQYDPARQDYTRHIEATLELLGFDVRPVVTDFDTVVDLAFTQNESGERQYDMYVLGWTLGSSALPDYHRWLFAGDGAANSTGYSDQGFADHLVRYEQATSLGQARSALWDMEQTLARDLPYLVLYHPETFEAYRSDRIRFDQQAVLGGIQGRLGGLAELHPMPAGPPGS